MIKLKQAIAVRSQAETPLIESPVHESQANGRIERAIRKRQAPLRMMRDRQESRLGARVDTSSAFIEWVIVWTADILSKYTVHMSGRASYEMATQHTVKHKVIGFSENVHFQFQIQREKKNACSNERSGAGWFVGIANRNMEYLVATKDGIISCSTVRRLPDNEAYDKKCIEEVDVKFTDYVKIGSRTAPIA